MAPDATAERIDRYLSLYDEALPQVFGYVVRRVESQIVAEDVTAETFLSAMATLKNGTAADVSIPWIIGVARHKVADHWRRQSSEERRTEAAAKEAEVTADLQASVDSWDAVLDAAVAHDTLASLSAINRAALTLRYLDGLPVGEIAHLLDRSVGATESLLTRAKAAFRAAYPTDMSGCHESGDRRV